VIGTLNEGALHAQLKVWYGKPGDLLEQKVGGYVVDLVRGDLLVEFQTGGFAPLRTKLAALADQHRVRLVAPVAVSRRIVRLSDAGEILSARRSPRHGCLYDVFDRLVSIPALVAHPNFELEVLLTHQDELRVYRPGRAYRRRGWDDAVRGFEACLTLDPEDPPSRVFLARVMQFREYAPANDWDGVWALEVK